MSDSADALNAIVTALNQHPNWKVRIEGFTDNIGSAIANLRLSANRAQVVMSWLADHGIDRSRLNSKGYGETRPAATNTTEEGRAKNRRVVLVRA